MATIASSLKLMDAMSRPLQQITNAINLVISAMHQMNAATGQNAQVTRTLTSAQNQLRSAEAGVAQAIEQVTREQERLNNSNQKASQHTEGLTSSIKNLAAAYLTLQGGQQLVSATVGGAMELEKMKGMLIARTGDEGVGTAMFDQIKKEALRTGADVKAALTGTLSFFSMTKDTGKLGQLNQLAQQMAAFDTSGQGLEGAVFALKEAASGDIVSLAERFNMSKTDIRRFKIDELGKTGNIDGFITAFNKLLESQSMGKEAFEKMMDQPGKKWEKVVNNFKTSLSDAGTSALNALMPVIDKLLNAFQSGKVQAFFDVLSIALGIAAHGFVFLLDLIELIGVFFYNNWDIIGPILAGIAGAILYMIIPSIWRWVVGLWAMVPPILTAAWAWMVMNWPIIAIGAAIALLVYILMKFGVSAKQVVGFVGGLFGTLFGFLKNQIAFIWNTILAFAEFFVNIFIDPVYAVRKLFYDLTTNIIDFFGNMVNGAIYALNLLVEAINLIPGISIPLIPEIDMKSVNAAIAMVKPTSDKGVVNFDKYKMKQTDYKTAFETGQQLGEGVYDKIANAVASLKTTGSMVDKKGIKLPESFDKIKQPPRLKQPTIGQSASNNLGNSSKNQGSIDKIGKVGEVGKINDKVDVASEDLKMMRELAEMKNIQNFVTLNPSVQVTTGDIRNGEDADMIVKRIEKLLSDQIVSTAQGVY